MKNAFLVFTAGILTASIFLSGCQPQKEDASKDLEPELNLEDSKVIKQLFDEALTSRETYGLLEELCLDIGPRLSGSDEAAIAVAWTEKVMTDYGFDKVYKQDVMVPNWKRGAKEVAKIVGSNNDLSVLALGMSVPTPEEGLTAEIIEV